MSPKKAKKTAKKVIKRPLAKAKKKPASKAALTPKKTKKASTKFTASKKSVTKKPRALSKKARKALEAETKTTLDSDLYNKKGPVSDLDEVCRVVGCESIASTGNHCRLHYIKNWKKIKRKELILKEGKLNSYIEELVAKYPDKYIEAIRNDLADNSEFAKVVSELELAEGIDDFDLDSDAVEVLIESIRRDVDDDSESF